MLFEWELSLHIQAKSSASFSSAISSWRQSDGVRKFPINVLGTNSFPPTAALSSAAFKSSLSLHSTSSELLSKKYNKRQIYLSKQCMGNRMCVYVEKGKVDNLKTFPMYFDTCHDDDEENWKLISRVNKNARRRARYELKFNKIKWNVLNLWFAICVKVSKRWWLGYMARSQATRHSLISPWMKS